MTQWPYLQAGIDRGLTEAQASALMGTVDDHAALNLAPRRTVDSMVRRCPDLFTVIDGRTVYPTEAGKQLAWRMHAAWREYMDAHASPRDRGSQ